MDKAKKQKVILGVLAALVLGMGSVWFVVFREPETKKVVLDKKQTERTKRGGGDKAKETKGTKRTKRKAITKDKKTAERTRRTATERKKVSRKKRKGRTKKIRKKKAEAPAA